MAEGPQRQGHIAVANPFENSKGHLTTKYCIWDVLQHHPEGLPLAQLVEKVSQKREAPMKNPTSTVMLLLAIKGIGSTCGKTSFLWGALPHGHEPDEQQPRAPLSRTFTQQCAVYWV